MQTVKDYFRNDRFARANGIELAEVRPGYAVARMTVKPDHRNPLGLVHGGILFTLADLAFAAACSTPDRLAVGTNMTISCLRATSSGTVQAEATETARTRTLSTCQVRMTDQDGRLVALFNGTAYLRELPFRPARV